MPPLQLCSYRQATSAAGFPFHSRKSSPPVTRRRALELLVRSPDGMAEAMLRAHGITVEILVDLVQAGLATANYERVAGNQAREIRRLLCFNPMIWAACHV